MYIPKPVFLSSDTSSTVGKKMAVAYTNITTFSIDLWFTSIWLYTYKYGWPAICSQGSGEQILCCLLEQTDT